ncbi:MAG: LysE family transporter [Spirochaetota bacterium]|nr:MAG: LysE family transporter [Spirochaetota bacterium]
MKFVPFLLQSMLISLTGVMAPGPITAVTVGKGNESPHAGALIAIGHSIIEFPLMVAIFYGFGYLIELSYVKASIALMGGLFLVVMAIGMIRAIRTARLESGKYISSSLVAGILLSAGNPYFLIWWITIGAAMVMRSVQFGIFGFITFAMAHWICDFVWCYFLSALAFKGRQFFGNVFQKAVFGVCGAFLLFLSGKFIFDGVKGFL